MRQALSHNNSCDRVRPRLCVVLQGLSRKGHWEYNAAMRKDLSKHRVARSEFV